jgi:putative DNA primase/helicase
MNALMNLPINQTVNAPVSIRRYEPTATLLLPNHILTEDYAATEFVERYGDNLRYCHTTGSWFIFKTTHWQQDGTGEVFQMARILARQLSENQESSKIPSLNKTAFTSGIERFAKNDQRVAVKHDYWDADPWLLGTPGGTIDLRTGELRDPNQQDAITKLTAVPPLDEDCPLWLKFLLEATGGDIEFIRFLQQWCGYCLTGVTREHALVFVYGPGGNGKSVFLKILTRIFGDYVSNAAMDTFTSSKNEKHPTDLAKLRGARLVTASETEADKSWAEARIKQLTGGDVISARFMRQDFFEYLPQFKLMIVGNHTPVLHNVDDAAKRRFNIVPFILKPDKPDLDLEEKLFLEAGGILQWMIKGCLDWQANGLSRPDCVTAATKDYFDDQDLLGQWIEDCCDVEIGTKKLWERSADLYDSWNGFSTAAGEPAGTKTAFGSAMRKKGFLPEKIESARAFRFIRLKLEPSSATDFNKVPQSNFG